MIVVKAILIICGGNLALASLQKLCKIDDNACILKTANEILQAHPEGSSELSLASIDPLNIANMTVEQNSGIVTVLAKLKDFQLTGFSKGKFLELGGFDKGVMRMRMKSEQIKITSIYDVDGLILFLPIQGRGKFKMTVENFDMSLKLPLEEIRRDNQTFFNIGKPQMTFDFTGGDVHLSHLGSFANGFLNYNFNIIINAVKTVASKSLVEKFSEKINSVFSSMSVNELFAEK